MFWSWLAGILIPLAIHLGVEAVLAKFPNLPPWLVTILKGLEGAKQAAANLPQDQQAGAISLARAKAAAQVHLECNGVGCPPELKNDGV